MPATFAAFVMSLSVGMTLALATTGSAENCPPKSESRRDQVSQQQSVSTFTVRNSLGRLITVSAKGRPSEVPDPPLTRDVIKTGVPCPEIEAVVGESRRQYFTAWMYEEDKDRFYCYYYFRPNPELAAYKKQLVVYYHRGFPGASEFMYFYNFESEKYWGRCATPDHPEYNSRVAKWQFNDGGWGTRLDAAPSIPGSTDRKQLDSPPHPPQS